MILLQLEMYKMFHEIERMQRGKKTIIRETAVKNVCAFFKLNAHISITI